MEIMFIILMMLLLAAIIVAVVIDDGAAIIPIAIATLLYWAALIISTTFILDGKKSYKQGQLDYRNGIIKYELKLQPDSTITWEEIKTLN